jgi:glycosyltransferase involved in cell wall biosynthesis
LLRVLHVYKDIHPPVVGGVEKHIDSLRRAMPGVRTDVLVCSRGPRTIRREVAGGTEVLVAEAPRRMLAVPIAPTFPRWLKRQPADIVHLHMPNPLGEASALLAAGDRPLVFSYHADIVRQARLLPAYRRLVDACLKRAAAVVVGSRRVAETSPLLSSHADRITVIPYGVDPEHFAPERVSAEARAELRRRFGAPLVLATGRLVYYKGFEHLIAAARRLDASVVIAGGGPWEPRLRELASGVRNVHMVGRVSEPDLVDLLGAADCFVLPSTSRAESFGFSTLEAQAMGLPAVVTDVGTGTVEAIEPDRTGVVVPPADPAALSEAIEWLLADRERAKAMGEAARARIIRSHSLSASARELEALYASITR